MRKSEKGKRKEARKATHTNHYADEPNKIYF